MISTHSTHGKNKLPLSLAQMGGNHLNAMHAYVADSIIKRIYIYTQQINIIVSDHEPFSLRLL